MVHEGFELNPSDSILSSWFSTLSYTLNKVREANILPMGKIALSVIRSIILVERRRDLIKGTSPASEPRITIDLLPSQTRQVIPGLGEVISPFSTCNMDIMTLMVPAESSTDGELPSEDYFVQILEVFHPPFRMVEYLYWFRPDGHGSKRQKRKLTKLAHLSYLKDRSVLRRIVRPLDSNLVDSVLDN